jgi:hypothetical protein
VTYFTGTVTYLEEQWCKGAIVLVLVLYDARNIFTYTLEIYWEVKLY